MGVLPGVISRGTFGLLLIFLLISCAKHWTVRNLEGGETRVKNLRLSQGKYLQVQEGVTMRYLDLKSIASLSLNPQQVRTEKGRVYYGAKLSLEKGTNIPADSTGKAWIFTDALLVGKVEGGTWKTPLVGVSEIRRIKEKGE